MFGVGLPCCYEESGCWGQRWPLRYPNKQALLAYTTVDSQYVHIHTI